MEENKEKPTTTEIKPKPVMVETYAEDMAAVLENDREGLVRKIIRGEEKREEERKDLSPESKKNRVFMIVGGLLLLAGLGILSFFLFNRDIGTVPVEQQFTPLVFNDKTTFLEVAGLKKDDIIQIILSQVNTAGVKIGGVEGIYLTENKQIIGLRRFLSLIQSTFKPGDNLLFVSDNFLLGAFQNVSNVTPGGANNLFILLKVRSTPDIFDALRAWEGKMFFDLHGLLGIPNRGDTNYLLTKDFTDGIVENKNARILYSNDGQIVLAYIFADDTSVIITGSEGAASEIITRLASAQKKQ